jgi:hypothetical protein
MLLHASNMKILTFGGMGYIYKYKCLADKENCCQQELDVLVRAGDCAVRAVARLMWIPTPYEREEKLGKWGASLKGLLTDPQARQQPFASSYTLSF